jgi:putative chitinase
MTPAVPQAAIDIKAMLPHLDAQQIDNVDAWAPLLEQAMQEGGIDTPLRRAHFLAQIAIETDHFRTLVEYASGARYNHRRDLGNRPGMHDGETYKGRGAIQLTGRANYRAAGADLGLDLLRQPSLAAEPDNAFRIAVWFWNENNINEAADRDDGRAVTEIVNGGHNRLSARVALAERAYEAMTDGE